MIHFGPKIDSEGLSNRLGALEADVRTLKTANKHLELEWEELYDKVRHQMSRMSRRKVLDDRQNDTPRDEDTPVEDGNRVDPISARILRRRASNGGQP